MADKYYRGKSKSRIYSGIALIIFGSLWFLAQEGLIKWYHIPPLFLIFVGCILIFRGLYRGRKNV